MRACLVRGGVGIMRERGVMQRTSSRVLLVVAAFVLLLVPVAAIAGGGFTDVDEDSVFKADIAWLADTGVTKGCNPPTNDEFCPDGNVTREQMAAFMHRLAINRVVDAATVEGMTAAELKGEVPAATDASGGDQPQNNMQPNVVVNCIIATVGTFPQEGGGMIETVMIGEIKLFAGNFAPGGWKFCDGQILQINQHSALFAILGTTYGGDGRTTFALPDARGRSILHEGSGAGLTSRPLGSSFGTETERQTVPQMPSHTHAITP